MRRCLGLWLLVLLAACSGGAASGRGQGGGATAGGGGGSAGSGGHATPAKRAPRPITFAPCTPPPCMRHAGRGRYYQCLHAGGGQCFQYGTECTPADRCMLDARDGVHRVCDEARGGSCVKFSATACTPGG